VWVRLVAAVDTLLSPEGTTCPGGITCVVSAWGGVSSVPGMPGSTDRLVAREGGGCWCGVVGVGWLCVEMCIVDASIFAASAASTTVGCTVWW
jgi:hypothetical protein